MRRKRRVGTGKLKINQMLLLKTTLLAIKQRTGFWSLTANNTAATRDRNRNRKQKDTGVIITKTQAHFCNSIEPSTFLLPLPLPLPLPPSPAHKHKVVENTEQRTKESITAATTKTRTCLLKWGPESLRTS